MLLTTEYCHIECIDLYIIWYKYVIIWKVYLPLFEVLLNSKVTFSIA